MSLVRMVCEELCKDGVFARMAKDSNDLLELFRFLDCHAEEIDEILQNELSLYNFEDLHHLLKRGRKNNNAFDLAIALLKICIMTDKTYGEMVETRINGRVYPRSGERLSSDN